MRSFIFSGIICLLIASGSGNAQAPDMSGEEILRWAADSRDESDLDAAAAYLEKAAKTRPADAAAFYNLGTAYFYIGKYENAKRALMNATRIDPASGKAFNQLGVVQTELKDYAGAQRSLETSIRLDPADLPRKINLGYLFIRMGKFDTAIDLLERAKIQLPDQAEIRFNLAYAYGRKKDFRLAIAEAEAALRIDPGDDQSRLMLVTFQVACGDRHAALDQYRTALAANPTLGHQIYDIIYAKWLVAAPPSRPAPDGNRP